MLVFGLVFARKVVMRSFCLLIASAFLAAFIAAATASTRQSHCVQLATGPYLTKVDLHTGASTIIEPPAKGQGAHRAQSASKGKIRLSECNSADVSACGSVAMSQKSWKLPGATPPTSSPWFDPSDKVRLTDWAANAIPRFDRATEKFDSFSSDKPNSNILQMLGRKDEAWAGESGTDRTRVIRYPPTN